MKSVVLLFCFSLNTSLFAQQVRIPEIPYRSVAGFLKLPPDLYLGEVPGVAVNSKGHIFVFSRGSTTGPAYGASAAQLLEFGRRRQVSARDRPQPLCLVVRAHRAKSTRMTTSGSPTKARTWSSSSTRKAASRWCSDASRKPPTKAPSRLKHPKPPLPARGRHVSPGHRHGVGRRPAILTSATATSTRASPKSTRTATGSSRGANPATSPGSSTLRTASPSMRRANVYVADRGNRRIQVFDGEGKFLRADHHRRARSPQMPAPPSATSPTANHRQHAWRPARPGPYASRRGRIRCFTAPMLIPAGSTSSALDGKVLGVPRRVRQAAKAVRLDS